MRPLEAPVLFTIVLLILSAGIRVCFSQEQPESPTPVVDQELERSVRPISIRNREDRDNGTSPLLYTESDALLIGNYKYQNSIWPDLPSIPNEIEDLKKVLVADGFVLHGNQIYYNLDSQHLKAIFEDFIYKHGVGRQSTDRRLFIFYSGHGETLENRGYLVPVDAPGTSPDDTAFIQKALPFEQIESWSRIADAKHVLFCFDSCFAGDIFEGLKSQFPVPSLITRLTAMRAREFITAGSKGERVPGRSYFTPFLTNAIEGDADFLKNRYVTAEQIAFYVRQKVSQATHGANLPEFGTQADARNRGDFVFRVHTASGTPEVSASPAGNFKIVKADVLEDALKTFSEKQTEPAIKSALAGITVEDTPTFEEVRDKVATALNGKKTIGSFDSIVNAIAAKESATYKALFEGSGYVDSSKTEQRQILYNVQKVLSASSLYAGAIDGFPGQKTNQAIEAWQRLKGMPITGRLETSTLESIQSAIALGENVPAAATRSKPFRNSLGMLFLPVKGTSVLFSIWETRVGDFLAYCKSTGAAWTKSYIEQTQNHPAVNVSWDQATAFCEWLSQKENLHYRLPTDEEWSLAAGLQREQGETPEAKGRNAILKKGGYPWGSQFPPPVGAGNFADESAREYVDVYIHGYNDGFATTAPVGTFKPSADGLYDLSGNVWEWCSSAFQAESPTAERVMRGGGCFDANPDVLKPGFRGHDPPSYADESRGFRVVLEP